eukprot:TRINITY_DN11900_c0_g1_i1.p1 TRINITY_DN11900_c0_g1~~TRINITY_DN11900_c0_g1_i1.p1  ORF type:complete len:86 (+),score=9.55 TRINITY_DN11900_c0_g1_i1:65-322(+)
MYRNATQQIARSLTRSTISKTMYNNFTKPLGGAANALPKMSSSPNANFSISTTSTNSLTISATICSGGFQFASLITTDDGDDDGL